MGESVEAGTTGWSSKARERERERETMQAPLILAIQCVLCLARPHLEEAHRPRHVFDHQNAGIKSELFPQYQYREIDLLDLKSLENKLRIASDEEKIWMETERERRKFREVRKKDQENIMYPDKWLDEFPEITFRKTPILLNPVETESSSGKPGQEEFLAQI